MASREEFTAFIRSDHQQQVNGGNVNTTWGGQSTASKTRPPQPPKTGEQAPLLTQQPPMPQSVLPPQFELSLSQQLMMSYSKPKKGHARSRSDFVLGPPDSPSHPLKKGGGGPPIVPPPAGAPGPGGGPNRSNRPPRAGVSGAGVPLPSSIIAPPAPPQSSLISPLGVGSPKSNPRKNNAHRRAKSDIPLAFFGGSGASVSGGGRMITKEDLLKSLPNPRWGGAPPKPLHTRNRSRTGSDGPLLDGGSPRSSFSGGYGAISSVASGVSLQSIGNIDLPPDAKRSTRHIRAMSDASVKSVTTDMAKSALFKAVTDTGRIQLQLPKDSFRILMDKTLETGMVYKRKLVDEEDQFFVEFHSVEDDPAALDGPTCIACQEKQKRLPPDLYVMAVDSSIYRRMLDEVIASKTMPCGTFFCGHHEDVRHPDITIAALVVGVVFFLFLAGAIIIWD